MQKPLPDFTSPEWCRTSPRGMLYQLRAYVRDHEGPFGPEDVRRLMAAMCRLSIEINRQTHSPSTFDLDSNEASRLLHEVIADLER